MNVLNLEEGIEGYGPLMFIFLRVLLGSWLILFMWRLDANLHHILLESGIYAGIRPKLPGPLGYEFLVEGDVKLFKFLFYSAAFLFMLGIRRKLVTVFLVVLWIILHFKSCLVPYPADGSIGYTLLATLFIPEGENSIFRGEGDSKWLFPKGVYFVLWFSFSASLLFSAIDKMIAFTWRHGDALKLILNQVNAKDSFLTNLLLSLPDGMLTSLNYFVLFAEFTLPLLCIFTWGRKLFVFGFAIMLIIFDQTLMVREVAWGTMVCLTFLVDPKWFEETTKRFIRKKDSIIERRQYS